MPTRKLGERNIENGKPNILERIRKYGDSCAKLEEFINPEDAELKNLVESEYFPPRKIDVARLVVIAETSKTLEKEDRDSPLTILDLGSGKGLLGKLTADMLLERETHGMVVNLDINKKISIAAKKAYSETKNLHFVVSDSEKEASDIFNVEPELVVVSWAHPSDEGGPNYSETVKKLQPRFFVNIGEEGQDFTAHFDPKSRYVKVAEWSGPLSGEISTGRTPHFYPEGEGKHFEQNGSNLYEVFARKDVTNEQLLILRKELGGEHLEDKSGYRWEKELSELYPEPSQINFDQNTFVQKYQTDNQT